jgi:hypothetical protein
MTILVQTFRSLREIREARKSEKPANAARPAWVHLPIPQPLPAFTRRARPYLGYARFERLARAYGDLTRFQAMGEEFAGAVRTVQEVIRAQKSS